MRGLENTSNITFPIAHIMTDIFNANFGITYNISVVTICLVCFYRLIKIAAVLLSTPLLLCDVDDDVYLDKLQTRDVKKSILYM
jgi:hypothetical protein